MKNCEKYVLQSINAFDIFYLIFIDKKGQLTAYTLMVRGNKTQKKQKSCFLLTNID